MMLYSANVMEIYYLDFYYMSNMFHIHKDLNRVLLLIQHNILLEAYQLEHKENVEKHNQLVGSQFSLTHKLVD